MAHSGPLCHFYLGSRQISQAKLIHRQPHEQLSPTVSDSPGLTITDRVRNGRAASLPICDHLDMGAGVTRYGPALVGTGVAMLVIGTFLPWLRSGTALRDSYQSIAALRGPLAGANRPVVTMLDCWLAIIPVLGV